MLTIVSKRASFTAQGGQLRTLGKKAACQVLLESCCPPLHHGRCAVSCITHTFGMSRTGRLVGAGPRCLDLGRVFLITGACPGSDNRFGRIFSVTTHVCPSSPMTQLGATTLRLRGNTVSTTVIQLRGSSVPRT